VRRNLADVYSVADSINNFRCNKITMKVYCIPGFGVDEKIFEKLSVDAELHFLNWLIPLSDEPLESYAARMASGMAENNPVIVGFSFGGMVAIEIAKQIPVKKVILISSVKTRIELPLQLKLTGKLQLYKLFPLKILQQHEGFYELANKRLGLQTEEEKNFVNEYRRKADLNYIKWSFNQILNWKNKELPSGIVHIHGDKDMIFPIKNIRPTHIIKNGPHMMIWNRASEISLIINETLAELSS
jgi:pimeloyl-ACP methyl ester carboxylesterase